MEGPGIFCALLTNQQYIFPLVQLGNTTRVRRVSLFVRVLNS